MCTKEAVFSIIVPCYNVEQYVVSCVEKLQRQSYQGMEIILIDDGSTDRTYDLCLEMKETYQNVIAITHEYKSGEERRNLGQEATRNLGLEIASGQWVCFVDADDTIEEHTLEGAKSVFEREPDLDFILMGFSMVYDSGHDDVDILSDLEEGIYSSGEIAEAFYTKIPWAVISCVGTKIFGREFIDSNGLRFEIKYKYNEDGAFAVKAFGLANKIAHIKKANYKYLQRKNSIMHSYRPDGFQSLNCVISLLQFYFESFGVLENKEIYVLRKRLDLLWRLLQDEIIYKGKKCYLKLFEELSHEADVEYTCEKMQCMPNLEIRDKIRVFLIKHRWKTMTYILFKTLYFWRGVKI